MPYADDLALARHLADVADRASLPRFGALDLGVETKPDLTPVSDADRAVETALRELLAIERPDDAIIGEEYGASASSESHPGGRRWVIDPIDATKNFIRGVPVWATLIALLDGDDAVVGMVSAPALGHRWWAATDCGSWTSRSGGDTRPNRVSAVDRIADASISYSDAMEWTTRRAAFEELLGDCWRVRAYGDFWSHVLVAQGSVDVSAEPELSLWDVAALVPIIEEAGGRVTGVDGGKSPGSPSVLCSNGLLHDEVLRRLRTDG